MTKFGLLAFLLIAIVAFSIQGKMKAEFNKVIPFKKEIPIEFLSFSLVYKGNVRIPLDIESQTKSSYIIFEKFEVIPSKGSKIDVQWSSGLGEIGPSVFEVDSITYWLELKTSEVVGNKSGVMQDDELVVLRK